ncbi:spermidine/putrescine transport system permease protein [Anaerobranca californiensis DSM 14826]|jgi:spermidine/putrescine transport system permease protein|uniref:Spermidine/putrescine transport system permease protein n=1 Tax=Anaerobranca californiensis DSM 14826 TaxID=1120989 RepID=A0A1M6MW57_9FIRM|nr:ABC transporter permease [Anaerobranca californiensis]SHJ87715.1 spermidine/putrescine transport system permease protein [Anaerobranca californiensis DSM 14826]
MVIRLLKRIYLFLIYLFLYAPILVLVIFSFNDSRSRTSWEGFTLRWYRELFSNQQILLSLRYTLIIAVLAATISTIMGTLAAIGIYKMKYLERQIVLNLNYLPVLNPDILTGLSLMLLFIFFKIPLGFITLLLAHITFCIPYVILSVLPKLKQLPANTLEAAMDLGAEPFYAIRKVILPQITPGIITGALIAFSLSIDDFVISFFTTGQGVSNLSITIFSMARRGINPTINALSTLLFFSVLILLVLINLQNDQEKREEH